MSTPLRFGFAGVLLLNLCGCPPYDYFYGRVFLINSTGGTVRSISLITDHPMSKEPTTLSSLPTGQAGIFPGDHFSTSFNLRVAYEDKIGVPQTSIVPFGGVVPHGCKDDFAVELLPKRLGQNLLVGM